jgi:hypothetical protein
MRKNLGLSRVSHEIVCVRIRAVDWKLTDGPRAYHVNRSTLPLIYVFDFCDTVIARSCNTTSCDIARERFTYVAIYTVADMYVSRTECKRTLRVQKKYPVVELKIQLLTVSSGSTEFWFTGCVRKTPL